LASSGKKTTNINMSDVKIEPSWKSKLQEEFQKPYFTELTTKVKDEYMTRVVFPEPKNIFRAFELVPFEKIKVVILGQDPYHTPGVADGLAFSAPNGNKIPPSLRNIYKEIINEFGIDKYQYANNPDLTRWANQGVLLINNTLTVRNGEANSHAKFGWDKFTDSVITTIARHRPEVVFMLWGGFARGKKSLILKESTNHLILESAHPSPLSAHNGFLGNNHFKDCNEWLESKVGKGIEW
jgi:uracil-DNA glycosylase